MDLSILIPVFNAEKTLARTLDSVLSQKASVSWEIVAVDDGSTDKSLVILKEYEKKAAEAGILLRVFSFENGGVGKCRNRCLQAATGDCILFLDADDLLCPGAVADAMKKKEETGAGILLFDSSFLYPDGKTAPFPMASHPGGEMTAEEYVLAHPCPWNKICDRAVFTENQLFFEEGILYEDLALIPALGTFLSEKKIYYWKTPLHFYYQSDDSIMRSAWSEKRLDLFPALKALRGHIKGYDLQVEYLFFLHLYRNGMWQFWEAGREDAIRQGNLLMRENFPHWRKNPLIRSLFSRKEQFSAMLFYRECFHFLRIWKGNQE